MPIELVSTDPYIYSSLVGLVTNEELLLHYQRPEFASVHGVWRELVDGRPLTEMGVTADGQRQLAAMASRMGPRLRGGRVAMVANSEVTYGMFRMWELQREGLGFEVQVFRDFGAAEAWVTADIPEIAER
jgi:hypothetical protein